MDIKTTSPGNKRLFYSCLFGFALLFFRNICWQENLLQNNVLTGDDVGKRIPYLFLIWNLFLAWIPFGLSQKAESFSARPQLSWAYWPVVLLWLLFWPNAPYLLTDLIHLRTRPPVPLWYDALLLFTFAWTGIWFAVLSLQIMERQWRARLGARVSKGAVLFVLLTGSFGVFLGRVLRWNSWEVFTQPMRLLRDLASLFANTGMVKVAIGMSAALFLFLLMVYQTDAAVEAPALDNAQNVKAKD